MSKPHFVELPNLRPLQGPIYRMMLESRMLVNAGLIYVPCRGKSVVIRKHEDLFHTYLLLSELPPECQDAINDAKWAIKAGNEVIGLGFAALGVAAGFVGFGAATGAAAITAGAGLFLGAAAMTNNVMRTCNALFFPEMNEYLDGEDENDTFLKTYKLVNFVLDAAALMLVPVAGVQAMKLGVAGELKAGGNAVVDRIIQARKGNWINARNMNVQLENLSPTAAKEVAEVFRKAAARGEFGKLTQRQIDKIANNIMGKRRFCQVTRLKSQELVRHTAAIQWHRAGGRGLGEVAQGSNGLAVTASGMSGAINTASNWAQEKMGQYESFQVRRATGVEDTAIGSAQGSTDKGFVTFPIGNAQYVRFGWAVLQKRPKPLN